MEVKIYFFSRGERIKGPEVHEDMQLEGKEELQRRSKAAHSHNSAWLTQGVGWVVPNVVHTQPKVNARTVYGTLETPGRFPEFRVDGMANFYSHHVTTLTEKPPLPLLLRFFVHSHVFWCISKWYSPSHNHAESWGLYLLPVHMRHRLQTGWPWGWTCPFVLPFAACAALYAPCPCLQTSPPGLKRLPAAQGTEGDTQGMSLMHTRSSTHTSNMDSVGWDPCFPCNLPGCEFWPLQEGESIRK